MSYTQLCFIYGVHIQEEDLPKICNFFDLTLDEEGHIDNSNGVIKSSGSYHYGFEKNGIILHVAGSNIRKTYYLYAGKQVLIDEWYDGESTEVPLSKLVDLLIEFPHSEWEAFLGSNEFVGDMSPKLLMLEDLSGF